MNGVDKDKALDSLIAGDMSLQDYEAIVHNKFVRVSYNFGRETLKGSILGKHDSHQLVRFDEEKPWLHNGHSAKRITSFYDEDFLRKHCYFLIDDYRLKRLEEGE